MSFRRTCNGSRARGRFAIVAIIVALAPLLLCAIARAADNNLIPRAVFFGNPDRSKPLISPDGRRLAYLAPLDNVMNVWVRPVVGGNAQPVTRSIGRPIRSFQWAQNNQQIIYALDRNGDENFHVYAVDVGTGREIDLTPFEDVQARIIGDNRDLPDEILIAINNRNPQLHDAWRINTRTGEGKMVFQNDQGFAMLLPDSRLDVRLASKVTSSGGQIAYMRDSVEEPWYELASWSLLDADTSGPLGFSRDGKTIYLMDSRGRDTGALYSYSIDGKEGPVYTKLIDSERADLGDVIFHPRTGKPQAAAFQYLRTQWAILDPSLNADWETLERLNDGEMMILSRDDMDRVWTVAFITDDGPARFYLYDRARRKAEFLFTNRSQLERLTLAKMEPVIIKSRDGLDLVSYLTKPQGGFLKRNDKFPMVLLVHGGPWARDSWGYNSVHQWLANRGYAVLSVNYRGSTGFGKEFLNAGNREWARKMHEDLIDAVNWAVEEKIADPDRVAIMGGSYGGYAALVGLTFTPDYFAAGIDIVGPSHVRTLLETIPPYWAPIKAMFEQRVGLLSEVEYLDSISPLTRVDDITRPLLIGQGANDPRVKESESRQIVKAMQTKRLPVTYVVFPDEGHGFARPENNLAFFAVTEAFLAEHLGGKCEPVGSTVRQSSARIEAGENLIPRLRDEGD